jgi:mono/diheme cytochrome c family protein
VPKPRRPHVALVVVLGAALVACRQANPQLPALTAVPSMAPRSTSTLAAAMAPMGVITVAAPALPGQGETALGAPLFENNCSICHGVRGEGVDAPALRDNQFVSEGGDANVYDTVAGGRPDTPMPAWLQQAGGPLVQAQIRDVVAYLHTMQGVPPLPTATAAPPEPTEAPLPPGAPTPEPAVPSLAGGPGPAAALMGDPDRGRPDFGMICAACHGPQGVMGLPNPGSDDGFVPQLNPIDPTIANPDPTVFARQVDLFVEHGSIPSGDGPRLMMPDFGDGQMLDPATIGDLIAYVMALNGVTWR